jgi:hypothetical protein
VSRRPPVAWPIAVTSSSALPSSAPLTEPEVSMSTEIRGCPRRCAGRITSGSAVARRDGRPRV